MPRGPRATRAMTSPPSRFGADPSPSTRPPTQAGFPRPPSRPGPAAPGLAGPARRALHSGRRGAGAGHAGLESPEFRLQSPPSASTPSRSRPSRSPRTGQPRRGLAAHTRRNVLLITTVSKDPRP